MTWRPAHENHAIERVSSTLQFADAIPAKVFEKLIKDVGSRLMEAGFDNAVDLPGYGGGVSSPNMPGQASIRIHFAHGPWTPQAQSLEGRAFKVLEGGLTVEEISVTRNFITYATCRYDRWERMAARIDCMLGDFLTQAFGLVDISLLKLEYWDRFTFEGQLGDEGYGGVLNSASTNLPSFSHDLKGLWHSHVGYFESCNHADMRLINLNVDVIDVQPSAFDPNTPEGMGLMRRSVGIYTMAQDTTFSSVVESYADIRPALNNMHDRLKQVLRDVISSDLAAKISLNS